MNKPITCTDLGIQHNAYYSGFVTINYSPGDARKRYFTADYGRSIAQELNGVFKLIRNNGLSPEILYVELEEVDPKTGEACNPEPEAPGPLLTSTDHYERVYSHIENLLNGKQLPIYIEDLLSDIRLGQGTDVELSYLWTKSGNTESVDIDAVAQWEAV